MLQPCPGGEVVVDGGGGLVVGGTVGDVGVVVVGAVTGGRVAAGSGAATVAGAGAGAGSGTGSAGAGRPRGAGAGTAALPIALPGRSHTGPAGGNGAFGKVESADVANAEKIRAG